MDPPNMKGDLWCRVWCQYKFTAPTLARGVRINCTRKRPRLAENTWMGTGVLHRYLTTSTASASRESLQTFGNSHSSLPKERVDVPPLHMSYEEPSISYSYDTSHFNAFSLQQIDCAYTGIMAEQNSDTKSIGGQFVEEFNVKIDSLTEKICRDVEEKFNSYILSKGSKPIFSQEQKPINPELLANEDKVSTWNTPQATQQICKCTRIPKKGII
uniref:Uncharacterized protein n=1 Tax=Oryza glaberrima TaxID=4538 RepID=I1QS57_ORYGL